MQRTFMHAASAAVCLLTIPTLLVAQATLTPRQLANRANQALGLQDSYVMSVAVHGRAGEPVLAAIDLGAPALLRLTPHSVRAPNFELVEVQADGSLIRRDPGLIRTYRGEVVGIAGSVVAASLLEDGLYARIRLVRGEEYWVEPIAGESFGAPTPMTTSSTAAPRSSTARTAAGSTCWSTRAPCHSRRSRPAVHRPRALCCKSPSSPAKPTSSTSSAGATARRTGSRA